MAIHRRHRWLRLAATLGVLGIVPAALSTSHTVARASGGISVFVGYADNLRASATNFPTPWEGSPGIVYEGCSPSSGCSFDAGAVRVVNNDASAHSMTVVVKLDTCTYDLWPHDVSIAGGGQLVVTQTVGGASSGCVADGTMDTSDVGPGGAGWAGNCSQSGVIPEVDVTVDGTTTAYNDTAQVINTGGVDAASCPPVNGNESTQWSPIGTTVCAGSDLTLAPASQTDFTNTTASVTATLTNSCGDPIQGASVDFSVLSGPNSGVTGSGATDSSGNAPFSYSSTTTGTDTLDASITNVAGTFSSNTVTVTWNAPVTTQLSSSTALQPFAEGGGAAMSSTLTDSSSTPIAGKTVTMTLGSGGGAQSCSGVTNASGVASCTISPVTVALGPEPITDSFAGDAGDAPATNAEHAMVYTFSSGGSFVVGDRAVHTPFTGQSVLFWGSSWAKKNPMSGGAAPSAFKGFEDSPARPSCGVSWTTNPGNSLPPPATLPAYMAVIVSSRIKGAPSNAITGNDVHVVIVQTNPGYGPQPSTPGTGTIVAVVC